MNIEELFLGKNILISEIVRKMQKAQNTTTKINIKNENGITKIETLGNPISILITLEMTKRSVIEKHGISDDMLMMIEHLFGKE